jgi:hypothetical protein
MGDLALPAEAFGVAPGYGAGGMKVWLDDRRELNPLSLTA